MAPRLFDKVHVQIRIHAHNDTDQGYIVTILVLDNKDSYISELESDRPSAA